MPYLDNVDMMFDLPFSGLWVLVSVDGYVGGKLKNKLVDIIKLPPGLMIEHSYKKSICDAI
jgi:hypothetical protein